MNLKMLPKILKNKNFKKLKNQVKKSQMKNSEIWPYL